MADWHGDCSMLFRLCITKGNEDYLTEWMHQQEGHLAWVGIEFLFMIEEKRMKLCEKIQCLKKLPQQSLVLKIGVIWHILQTNFHNNLKKLFKN